jgi:hypothetical protein
MIANDALIGIAICLVIIAAIGVRLALSLRDIETSLDRVAAALEAAAARAAPGPGPAAAAAPAPGPGQAGLQPSEAEIAAAIAAAARFARQGGAAREAGTPAGKGA